MAMSAAGSSNQPDKGKSRSVEHEHAPEHADTAGSAFVVVEKMQLLRRTAEAAGTQRALAALLDSLQEHADDQLLHQVAVDLQQAKDPAIEHLGDLLERLAVGEQDLPPNHDEGRADVGGDDVPNDKMAIPDNSLGGIENDNGGMNLDWDMNIDIGSNFQFPPMPTPVTAGKQKKPNQAQNTAEEDDDELPPPLQIGRAVRETEQMAQTPHQVVESTNDDRFVRPRAPRKRQRTNDSVLSTVTSSIREVGRMFVDGVKSALRRGPEGRSLEATMESARRADPARYNAFAVAASAASSPLTPLPPTPAPLQRQKVMRTPAARRFVYPKRPADCVTDTATSVGGSIWVPETPLDEKMKRRSGFAPRGRTARDIETDEEDMEPVKRDPYPQRSRRRRA